MPGSKFLISYYFSRTNGTDENLIEVNLPLNICWTCKNGQIWISIARDESPQVVIQNETGHQLVYAEGSGQNNEPVREALHFPQYHSLPPFSRGFYTFPSSQARFPEIIPCFKHPTFLLGRYVRGIEDIYRNVRRYNMICRSKSGFETA
jgi:hypothetical protein